MGILKSLLAILIALVSVILAALYFFIKLVFAPVAWVFLKIGAYIGCIITWGLVSPDYFFKESWQQYWEG